MTDHRIFAKLTQHWENEFHEDMKALNVCVHHKSITSVLYACLSQWSFCVVLIYHKLPQAYQPWAFRTS